MRAHRDRNGKAAHGDGNGKSVRKVRYAVIGLGNIAQVAVLPAFRHAENSELVALVSSDAKKLRLLRDRYRVPLVGSYEEMAEIFAAAGVQAAYLAVPNSAHRELTEAVAKLGVHVLCEKPMAMTVADCQAMIRATRAHRVKLMIAYRLHFEQANLGALELIRKGRIGKAQLFSSVFSHQVRRGDIRTRRHTGGGALFDLGVYCVNAARHLFGAEPEEVFGAQIVGPDARFPDVDAVTTALLRFPRNRLAQFVASQGAADVGEYRVVGGKGDVRLDPAYEYADGLQTFVTVNEKTERSTVPKSDQFAPELIHFSECILNNRIPEASGEEGLADVRVLEAIARSAKTGKKVKLAPLASKPRLSARQAMKKPAVRAIHTVKAPSPSK